MCRITSINNAFFLEIKDLLKNPTLYVIKPTCRSLCELPVLTIESFPVGLSLLVVTLRGVYAGVSGSRR